MEYLVAWEGYGIISRSDMPDMPRDQTHRPTAGQTAQVRYLPDVLSSGAGEQQEGRAGGAEVGSRVGADGGDPQRAGLGGEGGADCGSGCGCRVVDPGAGVGGVAGQGPQSAGRRDQNGPSRQALHFGAVPARLDYAKVGRATGCERADSSGGESDRHGESVGRQTDRDHCQVRGGDEEVLGHGRTFWLNGYCYRCASETGDCRCGE